MSKESMIVSKANPPEKTKKNPPRRDADADPEAQPSTETDVVLHPPWYLKVLFDGLCGFVSHCDHDRMRVLLLNATAPARASSGQLIPPHLPVLRIHNATGAITTDQPDAVIGNYSFFFLDQQDLEFRKNGAPVSDDDLEVYAGSPDPYESRVPMAQNQGDFRWLPIMSRIDGSQPDLNSECLAPYPPPGLVLARVALRSGMIRTGKVVSYGSSEPVLWQFRPRSTGETGNYNQALAADVHYSLKLDSHDTLHVRLSPMRAGIPPRDIQLFRRGNNAKIEIVNLPTTRSLEIGGHPYPAGGTAHFELLYRLCEQVAPSMPVPQPTNSTAADLDGPGAARGGNSICPGAVFPPHRNV